MATAIVAVLVFSVVLFLLMRGLPKAPLAESEQELIRQGLSNKEAKREARAQRNEYRTQRRLTNESVRTATKVANAAARITKQL